MRSQLIVFVLLQFSYSLLFAQQNPQLSSVEVASVLEGNYDPASYQLASANPFNESLCDIVEAPKADSLLQLIETLASFGTRHTWSDTISSQRGIGAARRWAFERFTAISQRRNGRLLPAYLSFDINNNNCGALADTKNVLAVLPGSKANKGSILLMAHLDSRCDAPCDTACDAPGADDNGSGSALVLELARVLSNYRFEHNLIFLLTTGEEQGLLGAEAFSDYCVTNNIAIEAVLNNDIVGGVICGETASPPGCSPAGDIDSMRVRMYTNPFSSRNPNQGYARSIKLNYQEKVSSNMPVPMEIELVDQEDRSGRGGDHIAFRRNNFLNVRFTSAHEHGNGNPLGTPNYQDRQHTSNDIIGEDQNGDGVIDSFYVDMNYLQRNAVINATAAYMLSNAPATPQFILHSENSGLRIEITDSNLTPAYRVGVKGRAGSEFDSIYRFSTRSFVVPGLVSGNFYLIAVAALDSNGLMSPFSQDERATASASTAAMPTDPLNYGLNCAGLVLREWNQNDLSSGAFQLLKPYPNPAQSFFNFSVIWNNATTEACSVKLEILDSRGGKTTEASFKLYAGDNHYRHATQLPRGLYFIRVKGEMGASNWEPLMIN
jgi:hypothetical protein